MKTMKTKTTKKTLLVGAFIATAALFTACTNKDDIDEMKSGERGVVKTEFTISLPAKSVGSTRMTTAIVQGQATPVFRGIGGIELYPFDAKVANISAATSIPTAITLTGVNSSGGAVAESGYSGTTDNVIANSGALYNGNNAHLYQDLEIAIGTKAFMFYGVALASSGGNRFTDGDLVKTVASGNTLGDITFTPKPIYQNSLGDNYDDIENYLSAIANTTGWYSSDNVILQTLYNQFISMKAGSWASVKGAVQQLYTTLRNKTFVATADNTLKNDIIAKIKTTQAADSDNNGTLEFQTLGDFPADISLPDGAIHMNWVWADDSDHSQGKVFRMMTNPATDNSGMDLSDLTKYVYPASLYYRVLSNIRTSIHSEANHYAPGTNDYKDTWAGVVAEYGDEVVGTNDEVKYNTRSIAIVDQVQYAVARLDVTVSASSDNLLDGVSSNIPLTHTPSGGSTVNNFPVTGLLIGNQRSVDYKFNPVADASPTLYTIYDKTIEVTKDNLNNNVIKCLRNVAVNTLGADDIIHTLVLETPVTSTTEDPNAVVKIAVEFRNDSGMLFVGQGGNIIYPGGKFYLVGTFDPKNTSNTTANPDDLSQVFKQDYTTTANLVVGSLRSAYNTLPDLRAPQLELGLSVNLTWNPGITQTININ